MDGKRPGGIIRLAGTGPHRVRVKLRVKSHVAPVDTVQFIAGGKVVAEHKVPPEQRQGRVDRARSDDRAGPLVMDRRAGFRVWPRSGAPDAEAHTNPVYVDIGEKAPYNRDSLDRLIAHLDQQMAIHRKRTFAEKARVLDYFQKSRDILLRDPPGRRAALRRDSRRLDRRQYPRPRRSTPAGARTGKKSWREFLEPLPAARRPKHSRHSKRSTDLHLQLVAAEPLVQAPVAAAFDADGNLYVAEMRDYPYKPKPGGKPLGTVRLLRDRDGDGRFEESHVFADGLLWAAGIAPWKDGVFVTAPPDIWYLKDTDGDGKADVREKSLPASAPRTSRRW